MSLLDRILKRPVDYVEGRVEEVRLQLREDASGALAQVAIYLTIGVISTVALILLSVAIAIVLGSWIGLAWGYAIVGGVYVALALGVWMYFRKPENQEWLVGKFRKILASDADEPISPEVIEEEDYPLGY